MPPTALELVPEGEGKWERREETGVSGYYCSLRRSFREEGGEWPNGAE
jgi:hypothetical protein